LPDKLSKATIEIFNTTGQRVWSKQLSDLQAGSTELTWSGQTTNGGAIASGVYIYRLTAGSYTATKHMLLLK
jgi:flagellar hook assembly protein FlgD